MTRDEIALSHGIALGEGWHDVEQGAHDDRPLRWTSIRSALAVSLGVEAGVEDMSLVLRVGSPPVSRERGIAISGSAGVARKAIRVGWHAYVFPLRDVLGPSNDAQAIFIEVTGPVPAPGDPRVLGVMVTDVELRAREAPLFPTADEAEIALSPAIALGEGWYALEAAADGGRPLRWASGRASLAVRWLPTAVSSRGNIILHLGHPGPARRQMTMTGPAGAITRTLRPGWDYHAFALEQLIAGHRGASVALTLEVSEPLAVPGDSRVLGAMVDEITLEDEEHPVVDGMVATVNTYHVEGTALTLCDYAGSTAAAIVVEELQADAYQLGTIDFQPGDVVIDIGAHIGAFSTYLAKRYPFVTILAFEPIPVSYRMFRKNAELNKTRNIRLYNLAVTSDRRPLTMLVHLQGNTGGATANLANQDREDHARFTCSSLTLDDIFQSFLIESCKLLKIDCEGSEHEILLTARCLDRVQTLRGEFHINEHLRRQGYSIDGLARHCRRFIAPERIVFTPCQMSE